MHEKKRARVSAHPKCLHIGIILIVYVIQKVLYANKFSPVLHIKYLLQQVPCCD